MSAVRGQRIDAHAVAELEPGPKIACVGTSSVTGRVRKQESGLHITRSWPDFGAFNNIIMPIILYILRIEEELAKFADPASWRRPFIQNR